MDLTQKFLDEIYLREQIPSDLSSLMKRLSPSKMKALVNTVKKAKDINAVKKVLSFVPVWPLSKIESTCRKLAPDFDKCYTLSKKVVVNSLPDLPKDVAFLFACGIALKSSYKNDDPIGTTKKNLKIDIEKVSKHLTAYIALGVTATLLASVVVYWIMHPVMVAIMLVICVTIVSTAIAFAKGD